MLFSDLFHGTLKCPYVMLWCYKIFYIFHGSKVCCISIPPKSTILIVQRMKVIYVMKFNFTNFSVTFTKM
jgi:hypothetical protein